MTPETLTEMELFVMSVFAPLALGAAAAILGIFIALVLVSATRQVLS